MDAMEFFLMGHADELNQQQFEQETNTHSDEQSTPELNEKTG